MYPNEHYFQLIENDVPEEIRESFLARCKRKREIDTLKKNPADMMEQVARGIETVKEHGKEIIMRETEKHMNQGSSGKAGENGG